MFAVFLHCTAVLNCGSGHPRPSRWSGPSVPWVSLPGPGAHWYPSRMVSRTKRQPSGCCSAAATAETAACVRVGLTLDMLSQTRKVKNKKTKQKSTKNEKWKQLEFFLCTQWEKKKQFRSESSVSKKNAQKKWYTKVNWAKKKMFKKNENLYTCEEIQKHSFEKNAPSHQKSPPSLFFLTEKKTSKEKKFKKKKFKTFEDEQSFKTVSKIKKWKSFDRCRS